jgi:tetratricopeptide (TPR) repeat protein
MPSSLPLPPAQRLKRAWFLPEQSYFEQSLDALKDYVYVGDRPKAEPLAHAALATRLFDEGKVEEAIVFLQTAIELAPEQSFYPYLLGYLYLRQAKLDLAEAQYNQVFAQKPDHPAYYAALAHLRFVQGYQQVKHSPRQRDYCEQGLAAAKQGLQIAPEHHDCLLYGCNNLLALQGLGNEFWKQEAEEMLTQFLKYHSHSPDAHHTHSFSLILKLRLDRHPRKHRPHRQQIIQQAIQSLQIALQIEPDRPGSKDNLKWLLSDRNDPLYWLPKKLQILLGSSLLFILPLLGWTFYSYHQWGFQAWPTILGGLAIVPGLLLLLKLTYLQICLCYDPIARQYGLSNFVTVLIIFWGLLSLILTIGFTWKTLPLSITSFILFVWWWMIVPLNFLVALAIARRQWKQPRGL